MNTSLLICTRTAFGSAEPIARQSALGASANSLLMLVDGRRSRADLLAALQPQNTTVQWLDSLVVGGHIEERSVPATPNSVIPAPTANATVGVGARADDKHQRARWYRQLVAAAKTEFGLRGFLFQLRIEKAVF
ncbi:MAG: hypothetical protein LH479_13590 [Polaromonas sp.]|nr:hypothetical protein [Polaromonas sp.]